MKKQISLLFFFILLGGFSGAQPAFSEPPQRVAFEYIPNELIIKVQPDVEPRVQSAPNGNVTLGVSSLDPLANTYGLIKAEKVFKTNKRPSPGATYVDPGGHVKAVPDLTRWYKLTFRSGVNIIEALDKYKGDPNIVNAHRNTKDVYLQSPPPNDPYYPYQWALENHGQQYPYGMFGATTYFTNGFIGASMEAEDAWQTYTGAGDNIIVAVIDSGIDGTHEDLSGHIWVNPVEAVGVSGVDDDGNGYVDDFYGWNLLDNNNNVMDTHGHGTAVAGIIAATANNGIGIAGVHWGAKILTVKVSNSDGLTLQPLVAEGIRYAADNGAKVINLSLGALLLTPELIDAIEYAFSRDCVIVAGAGNEGYRLSAPMGLMTRTEILKVAAVDSTDCRAWDISPIYWGSNYGPWVDISAPGKDVLTLRAANTYGYDIFPDTNGRYVIFGGTSAATAYASGAAALLRSYFSRWHPEYNTNLRIMQHLMETAANIDGLNPGAEGDLGRGRVDVNQALRTLPGVIPEVSLLSVEFGLYGPFAHPGDSQDVTITLKNEGTFYARNVQAELLPVSGYFTCSDCDSHIGDIAPGETVNNSADIMHIEFSAGCPVGILEIPFEVSWDIGATHTSQILVYRVMVDPPGGVSPAPGWQMTPQGSTAIQTGGPIHSSPVIEDLDGNGTDEIVFGADDGKVYVLNADGSFVPPWPIQTALPYVRAAPAVGDLDGDGNKEIVALATNAAGTQTKLYAWHSDGTLLSAAWPKDLHQVPGPPVLADLAVGSGGLEIAVAENYGASQTQKVHIFKADGTEPANWPKTVTMLGNLTLTYPPAVGNIDSGSSLEIVQPAGNHILAWHSDGTPVFTQICAGYDCNQTQYIFERVALGDLTGDGTMEILSTRRDASSFTSSYPPNLMAYTLNGSGSVIASRELFHIGDQNDDFLFPETLALADLEGDGDLEIALAGYNKDFVPGHTDLYLLDSNGVLLAQQRVGDGWVNVDPPAIADLDSDDVMEVLYGFSGSLSVMKLTGGTLPGFPLSMPLGTGSSPALADFDGDQHYNIAIGAGDNRLYAINLTSSVSAAGRLGSPMLFQNACHTGFYRNPVLRVPAAYPTIRDAYYAAVDGDKILVGPGTYSGTLTIDKRVEIVSAQGPSVTTIVENPSERIGDAVQFRSGSTGSILEGFTITTPFEGWGGEGIWVRYGVSPIIRNNIISNLGWTGIRVLDGSAPTIEQNLITDNNGDGIEAENGSNPLILNNTIARNEHAGVSLSDGSSPAVVNNLIINNSQDNINVSGSTNAAFSYNDVWRNIAGDNYDGLPDQTGQNGNISQEPRFVSASDYHLDKFSPAIDSADGGAASPEDAEGNPRFNDPDVLNSGVSMPPFVDMGAFERQTPSGIHVNPGDSIQSAINAASDGDTILVGPGTYLEDLAITNKAVTIQSTAGPGVTKIQGTSTGAYSWSITFSNSGQQGLPSGSLEGFTVTCSGSASGILATGAAAPTIRNNVITGCSKGITFSASSSPPPILIENNLIYANTYYGIYLSTGARGVIRQNTINQNTGGSGGGLILYNVDPSLQVTNNILTNNANTNVSVTGALPIFTFNDVWRNTSGRNYEYIADQTGLNGNISKNPLFVNSASGDYHLKPAQATAPATPGSPCIDAGDPALAVTEPLPPWATYGPYFPRVNMGAYGNTYEAENHLLPTAAIIREDVLPDDAVNLTDFGMFGSAYGSQLLPPPGDSRWLPRADFNHDNNVNLTDFGIFGAWYGWPSTDGDGARTSGQIEATRQMLKGQLKEMQRKK